MANRKLDVAARAVRNEPGLVEFNIMELVVAHKNFACRFVENVGDIS